MIDIIILEILHPDWVAQPPGTYYLVVKKNTELLIHTEVLAQNFTAFSNDFGLGLISSV